jgi:histidinol-phosphate aminotransferase
MKSDHIEKLARAAVQAEGLKRPDWTAGAWRDPRLLWLDKNENTDPELARFTAKLLAELPSTMLQTYPECAPLYRKLAAHLDVGIDSLLLAHGSDGVIRSVFEAFIDPGDVVLHTVPTFAMYPVYSKIYGANPITLEYEASASGPVLPPRKVIEAISAFRPKLVCLPNPDSPTGTFYSSEELRAIVVSAQTVGAVILIDEAYYPFHPDSAVPLLAEFPHLIIARTFAKAWGLAGLRIGYGVANPALARLLHKVRPMYEVNTVAVVMMERMLDFEEEMLASVARLNAGKDYFLKEMEKLGLRTLRGQGNFLHVAFGPRADEVHRALRDVVLYRPNFQDRCLQGFSRFSAAPRETLQIISDHIQAVVLKHK